LVDITLRVMGIRRRCVRIGPRRIPTAGCEPAPGNVPQACNRTTTTRSTTPRAAHFFRKNAKKTSEATSPKGFTSIGDVPQKSMKLRKNTSKNESKGFVRRAYVEVFTPQNSGFAPHLRGARRQTWRTPIAGFSIQILMASRAIPETRDPPPPQMRAQGLRAAKILEQSNKVLVSNRLCREGERSKNQNARSKNTRNIDENHCWDVGYVKSKQRSKNAKIARSPKKGF
jgi:hypothetical protein